MLHKAAIQPVGLSGVSSRRRGRVSDRRRGGSQTYNQAALNRVAERVDKSLTAVQAIAERMEERLERIEQDQAQGRIDKQAVDVSLAEMRRDVGELRDAIRIGTGSAVAAAAKGFWATKLGKIVVVCTGITAIVTAGEKAPKAARAVDDAWKYVVEQGGDE